MASTVLISSSVSAARLPPKNFGSEVVDASESSESEGGIVTNAREGMEGGGDVDSSGDQTNCQTWIEWGSALK